ncbi:class I SAM-dependent methyltransferase [Paenibacillus wulumuqiensis]|uniref:SAM-dependent methyltransferase n=1 Tax=Paenibacillus wulumuqiensis TaxID=1567107 RepID=UPI000697D567|nr:SAM-dependent methyltransferase [Paenibacillus wulumuqiensis]
MSGYQTHTNNTENTEAAGRIGYISPKAAAYLASKRTQGLSLERIVFLGRTFEEYMSILGLEVEDLRGRRILDCPAGACSFAAEASLFGAEVTAADMAYHFGVEELYNKGKQDIGHMIHSMTDAREQYDWSTLGGIPQLETLRTEALDRSTEDRRLHPERYIPAVLPDLPFDDQTFDLTVSAHFLFLYADRLDEEFHIRCLRELMRVTRTEIRIFPLVNLKSERVAYVEKVVAAAGQGSWETQEIPTEYTFQKGADTLLLLKRV